MDSTTSNSVGTCLLQARFLIGSISHLLASLLVHLSYKSDQYCGISSKQGRFLDPCSWPYPRFCAASQKMLPQLLPLRGHWTSRRHPYVFW